MPPRDVFEYAATEADVGLRADALLAEKSALSRSAVQALMLGGAVRCGGKPVRKNARAAAGDVYVVLLPEPAPTELTPLALALDIVYEDGDLVVVNKPRGLVVHPAAGHRDDTLANALVHHCGGSLSGIGGALRPGIVHRLDRMTSGLIAVAKNDAAHRSLAEQIAARTFRRVYEAVIRGAPREDAGRIEAPVGRSARDRKKMAVVPDGRPAATNWCVLRRYRGYAHVECRLETGRTHQIRVHMAHIGHPVAGDTVYGGARDEFSLGGQCLHARTVEFLHPRSGERLRLTSELPDYFARVLTGLASRE